MKKILSIFLAAIMVLSLAACSSPNTEQADSTAPSTEKTDVNAYVINGPTGIGAAQMMSKAEKNKGSENYKFTVTATPEEVVSKISTGEADIAAVATNMAASLYNKTDGGIKIIAVNTMGVLYALNNSGAEINSIEDLKGRKIYTTGQGANPEYIIKYLLTENGINPEKDVDIEYKTEGSELVPVWATEPDAVIIAPQPVAATINNKYPNSVQSIDLTKEWEKVNDESALMMGCVVVRTEFLNEHPETVDAFLKDYEQSIDAVTEDIEDTAALCAQYGIVASAEVAKAAIPYCNICFVTGSEMKTKLTGYLNVLYSANPTSIGGKMPGDDFWYE